MSWTRDIIEAALEAGEGVADELLKSELLASIPVVGTAVKLCSAADDLRNRTYIGKLKALLDGLGAVSEDVLTAWRQRLDSSDSDLAKAGEMTLLLIERLVEVDRALIVGLLLRALVEQRLDADDYKRLALAVDAAYLEDLKQLLGSHKCPESSDALWMKYLANSGLTEPSLAIPYGGTATAKYSVSKLGNRLRTAYFEGRKASQVDANSRKQV